MNNKQENKNDRGVLEQSQSVSCGSQALTYSPNVQLIPDDNTNNRTSPRPQLPERTATLAQAYDEPTLQARRHQSQYNDMSLTVLCDQLEHENAEEARQPHHAKKLSVVYSNDEDEGFFQCSETAVQTDPEESHELEEGSLSTLDVSLHSHYSDYEYDDDREYDEKLQIKMAQQPDLERKSTKAQLETSATDDYMRDTIEGLKEQQRSGNRPMLGTIYYLSYTLILASSLYANQQLFVAADHVAIMQFTFARGVICSIMVLAMVNVNVKQTLWDPVDRSTIPSLVFRCLQGGASVYISFSSTNFFNVSTVGIVCSLKPIIACLLGVMILRESMTIKDVVMMSGVFIAVFLVIFGSEGSQQKSMNSNPWAMVALISQPFLLAGGDVAMRRMRKMPEQLCSGYCNITLAFLASIYMLATGLSFQFFSTLSWYAWLMLFLSCFLTLLGQITKAAAFKHQENTKLQKLTFLQNVWMFGADLFILGVTFSGMQLTGFSLLVLFYITEGTYNVVERRMANKKEFVANDEEYQRL